MSDPSVRKPGALGQVFGATPATGLSGRLPRRADQGGQATTAPAPPPTESPTPAEPAAPAHVDQGPPAKQDRPPAQARPSAAAPPPAPAGQPLAAGEATYQVSVYVLPEAVRAAETMRRRTRRTNAEIAYAALDAVRDRLGELVATRQAGQAAADSMFPARRSRNPRAVAAQDGRRQLWSMQATEGELEVLDGLVERHGARSRSELISCAVEAYLIRKRGR